MIKETIALLLGYIVGRISHIINYYYTNTWLLPHHWIVAIIIFIFSFNIDGHYECYFWYRLRILIRWFAFGLFISDFNDFIHFQTFQPDATNTLPNFIGFD